MGKKKAAAVANAASSLPSVASGVASFSLSNPTSKLGAPVSMIQTLQDPNSNEDAINLRASLADPAAIRQHAPGEVAEHFRRLSEMKRKYRRSSLILFPANKLFYRASPAS